MVVVVIIVSPTESPTTATGTATLIAPFPSPLGLALPPLDDRPRPPYPDILQDVNTRRMIDGRVGCLDKTRSCFLYEVNVSLTRTRRAMRGLRTREDGA